MIINGGISVDDRGFVRYVNDFNPEKCGIKRFYHVTNHRSGFIRAWHGHLKESKYVYVSNGSALMAVSPISEDGKRILGPVEKKILSSTKPSILFIPNCMANGFKTLEDNTSVIFFSTTSIDESAGDDFRFPYDSIDGVWEEDFR